MILLAGFQVVEKCQNVIYYLYIHLYDCYDIVRNQTHFHWQALTYGILCQTLIDIQYQTSSSTEDVSIIFTARAVGFATGCIFLGHLFDIFNHNLLLGLSMFVAGLSNVIMPWFGTLLPILLLSGIQGVPLGLLGTGMPYLAVYGYHFDLCNTNISTFIQQLLLTTMSINCHYVNIQTVEFQYFHDDYDKGRPHAVLQAY